MTETYKDYREMTYRVVTDELVAKYPDHQEFIEAMVRLDLSHSDYGSLIYLLEAVFSDKENTMRIVRERDALCDAFEDTYLKYSNDYTIDGYEQRIDGLLQSRNVPRGERLEEAYMALVWEKAKSLGVAEEEVSKIIDCPSHFNIKVEGIESAYRLLRGWEKRKEMEM